MQFALDEGQQLPGEEHLKGGDIQEVHKNEIVDNGTPPEEPREEPQQAQAKAEEPKGDEPLPELDDDDPHPVPRKVFISQRQELRDAKEQLRERELELARIQGHMAAQAPNQPNQNPQETQQEIDPLDVVMQGPEAFNRYVDERIAQRGQEVVGQADPRFINYVRHQARQRHEDYDAMEKLFDDAVGKVGEPNFNRALLAEALKHPDPAQYAYEYGKTVSAAQNAGSIDELKKQWETEHSAAIEARLRKELGLEAADRVSTNGDAPSGNSATPVQASHQDFGSILPGGGL